MKKLPHIQEPEKTIVAEFVAHVFNEVARVLKEKPRVLGDDPRLTETLVDMLALDRYFEETGGRFFHTGSDAFETARKFTEIHIEHYRQTGRPSLAALAVHHAEQMGLDKGSAAYKALIMVAVRAEMKTAVTPDYHSKSHYMDVAAMTANLLEKNNEMLKAHAAGAVPLTQHEQALVFIAAIGHDIDHEGRSNPSDDLLFNEQKSFHLMEPLLLEAGLPEADISKIYTILMSTSPDGPHAVMKAVARAQRTGSAIDFATIDPANKFPALRVLAHDSRLTQMAAIVSDSDLYASSGAGAESNRLMSNLLTEERKKEDASIDLTTDAARKFFLDNVVGKDGYASNAGRAVAGDALEALRRETEKRLSITPKPPAP